MKFSVIGPEKGDLLTEVAA